MILCIECIILKYRSAKYKLSRDVILEALLRCGIYFTNFEEWIFIFNYINIKFLSYEFLNFRVWLESTDLEIPQYKFKISLLCNSCNAWKYLSSGYFANCERVDFCFVIPLYKFLNIWLWLRSVDVELP